MFSFRAQGISLELLIVSHAGHDVASQHSGGGDICNQASSNGKPPLVDILELVKPAQ